nr:acetoacetyl-coa synthetase [Quercus suber]
MDNPLTLRKLWEHTEVKDTLAYKFMHEANRKRGRQMQNWQDLHTWSVDHRAEFWEEVFQQHPIIHSGTYTRVVDESARMDSLPAWFEGVQVNFAENLLFTPDPRDPSQTTKARKEDRMVAATEVREGCTEIRACTWGELRERVAHLSNAMRAHGVGKGDRVAVVASNSIDTMVVFLAITAVGGIFSSSSTDMGTKGVLDRLLQTRPKYVFVDDWAVYNGKTVDLRPKMKEIVAGMSDVKEFEGLVSMPRWRDRPEDITHVPRCCTLATYLDAAKGNRALRFQRLPFRDPVIIVYCRLPDRISACVAIY